MTDQVRNLMKTLDKWEVFQTVLAFMLIALVLRFLWDEVAGKRLSRRLGVTIAIIFLLGTVWLVVELFTHGHLLGAAGK